MTDAELLARLDVAAAEAHDGYSVRSFGELFGHAAARLRELIDMAHRRLTNEQRLALAKGSDADRLRLWQEYYWTAMDADEAAEERAEAAERERDAIRELMNIHNLGGWTDALGPMKRALAAERERDEWKHQAEANAECHNEAERERDKLRELLTRARNPPKHHDCLPFSGNCEACILNYDIDAALAPEQASGPAQGIAKHAEFPMLCIGKAIDCVLPNGHDGDCQVP